MIQFRAKKKSLYHEEQHTSFTKVLQMFWHLNWAFTTVKSTLVSSDDGSFLSIIWYYCFLHLHDLRKKVNEILLSLWVRSPNHYLLNNKIKTFNSSLDLTLIHGIQRPIPKLELRIFDRNYLIGQKIRENAGFILWTKYLPIFADFNGQINAFCKSIYNQ